jgi:DNA ligase-associated metallophosphoesterase
VVTIEAGGTRLQLLPQRAAFLPDHGVLLVADAHIGKAVSFRRLGVPVPEATTAGTLDRLSAAIALSGARQVVFLGDLLHSARARAAETVAAVARWRERHAAIELTLVRGNHDGHAGDPPAAWGVRCVDEPLALAQAPGLLLCHHPEPREAGYVLAGHIHPSVLLGGRAHERLRLPCFHFGPQVGVLPAFGEFTGSHVLPRAPGDRVFAVTHELVREVPALNSLPR